MVLGRFLENYSDVPRLGRHFLENYSDVLRVLGNFLEKYNDVLRLARFWRSLGPDLELMCLQGSILNSDGARGRLGIRL